MDDNKEEIKMHTWETWNAVMGYNYEPVIENNVTVYKNKHYGIRYQHNDITWNDSTKKWAWIGVMYSSTWDANLSVGQSVLLDGTYNNRNAVWLTISSVSTTNDRKMAIDRNKKIYKFD